MKDFSYKHISKIANVSLSTVSRYFNGGYVSDKTKAKIENVISNNQYIPSLGSKLIQDRKNTIFVLLPNWARDEYFQSQVIQGLYQSCFKSGKNLLVSYVDTNNKFRYLKALKNISMWKPYAMVLFIPNDIFDFVSEELKAEYTNQNIFLVNQKLEGFNSIVVEYEKVFAELARTMIKDIDDNSPLIYVDDIKLDQHDQKAYKKAFLDECKKHNKKVFVYEINVLNSKNIHKLLHEFDKNNYVHVVCSSHSAYLALVSSHDKNLLLTDIGGPDIFDYLGKYNYKIFIDYVHLGFQIDRMISYTNANDKQKENWYHRPKIIKYVK
ncbi:LacI family DNA-binding transcriptional regulator [Mycoplasmopsis iners]|uniref:LacI family DNA-binding transcriptional regulator n=1 Tax=Mycoplasmopsis iners TaxID=76630 RepID=UPI0004967D09|nr:LacI family DNA-binding transcriptional regulator [Mycoplasmopsis iners]